MKATPTRGHKVDAKLEEQLNDSSLKCQCFIPSSANLIGASMLCLEFVLTATGQRVLDISCR